MRVPSGVRPGDIPVIALSTPWRPIVEELFNQRSASPEGTGGALARMGRGDVRALHGPAGGRAATWFDAANGICWFLGFTPEHDYSLLERRARNNELLPGAEDLSLLERDRGATDFDDRVRAGVSVLVDRALDLPRTPQRGTVGALLRLEMVAAVEPVATSRLVDLYLSVALPVPLEGVSRPPGWPGAKLPERLTALATGIPHPVVEPASAVPDGPSERQVDPARELAFVLRNWELAGQGVEAQASAAGFVAASEASVRPFLERDEVQGAPRARTGDLARPAGRPELDAWGRRRRGGPAREAT
ncbi:MAG TPA: hypothetical protein VMD59_03965 [Acidimicrobiales bacterium]|nr:hypothetical protein [Acidimicrobiales bacterium]